MYDYMMGVVTSIKATTITLDVNGVGYLINTPNPYSFNIDEEYKIYV